MILSKTILAATMSATVLWLAPIHGDGQHPAHEQCACGHDLCDAGCGAVCDHDHCGSDCDHEDADHAMPATASPDAHTGHSAVYTKEKCPTCGGKGKLKCLGCDGKGKFTVTEFTECKRCKGTGGIKGTDGKLIVKCPACVGKGGKSKDKKVKCDTCDGKGKNTCLDCGGYGYKL